jgi:hypothetical protein
MTLPVVFTANGPTGYNLTKSLRFRSSASAYLNRTPASASNRKTFTISAWVKKGQLGVDSTIFSAGYNTAPWFIFAYDGTNDTLDISATAGSSSSWKSAAYFRDPSAWYHVMCVVDTTSATATITNTATDRIRLYVNGVQQTLASGTVPTQNSDLQVNNTVAHSIGGYSGEYFDGYMAEFNFIDGQALTPSSFGSTNALTGVWQPAKYTGTYGTNGFYLPFTNTSSTSTLGNDFSGNSNTWTVNNISLTTGSTYDSMNDVPTLTSATTANYCVFNPLDNIRAGGGATYTNGNLTLTGSTQGAARGTFGLTSGKFRAELTCTSGSRWQFGIANSIFDLFNSNTGKTVFYDSTGYIENTGTTVQSSLTTCTTGDVITVDVDVDAGTISFYKNGTTQLGTTYSYTAFTPVFIMGYMVSSSVGNLNCGQQSFTRTASGFVALNTYNLPTSTIVKGNTVMDATTYTGTGATLSVVNTAGFKPDFVWAKGRSAVSDHLVYDSVRGATLALLPNLTDAEVTLTTGLTSFNSNGFTLGSNANNNTNGVTYVGWQWQAGQGTTSSNTSGSITSTVSVNATAGFSVVTYTGNATNGATVGHGLGVTPSMIIGKIRSTTGSWYVWQTAMGDNVMSLNTTAAQIPSTGNGVYNTASFSSTVFALGSGTSMNASGGTFVSYCWTPIAGYSAFGSYTGNGSADGPFVYTGFRPRWVMIKRTDTTNQWFIYDTARDTYNVMPDVLEPNLSNAEGTTSAPIDCLSNGFKLRGSAVEGNASGGTYIYMAFAENPFKNALAR